MGWRSGPWTGVGETRAVIRPGPPDTDFYLAGGTALALHEGHRISIDLDFMSATFADPESLIQTLRDSDLDVEVTITSSRAVYITTGGGQVRFFGFDYPQLEEVLQS